MSDTKHRKLAEHIAKAIFSRPQGFDLPPVTRIQFMHGNPEIAGGGLCFDALEETIFDALESGQQDVP